jgi:fibronectin type 3 domain-containing protein
MKYNNINKTKERYRMKKYLCKSIAVAMISITLFSSVGTVNTFAVENPEISIASEEVIKLGVTSKINATPLTKSIKLSWKKVANATGYRVYIYKNNKWTKLANTNKTTYTVKSLKSGTNYKLAVKAYSKTDDGTVWADSYKTVSAMTKLDKTSKITATTTESSVKLSWKKVTGATGYRVYQYNSKTGKYESIKTLTGTSYTVKKLKAGTTYKFAVKAYTKDDGSTIWASSSVSFKTCTKPATPAPTATAGSGKATIKWSKVTGATGYVVYMQNSEGEYEKIGSTKSTSYTKKSLKKGKTYYFRVRAYKTLDGKNIYGGYKTVKVKIK